MNIRRILKRSLFLPQKTYHLALLLLLSSTTTSLYAAEEEELPTIIINKTLPSGAIQSGKEQGTTTSISLKQNTITTQNQGTNVSISTRHLRPRHPSIAPASGKNLTAIAGKTLAPQAVAISRSISINPNSPSDKARKFEDRHPGSKANISSRSEGGFTLSSANIEGPVSLEKYRASTQQTLNTTPDLRPLLSRNGLVAPIFYILS